MKLKGGTEPAKPLKPVDVPMTNEQMTDDLISRNQLTKKEELRGLKDELELEVKHKELDEIKRGNFPLSMRARWTRTIAISGIIIAILKIVGWI